MNAPENAGTVKALEALVRTHTRALWPTAAWLVVDISAWRETHGEDAADTVAVIADTGDRLHDFREGDSPAGGHQEPGTDVDLWAVVAELADLGGTGSWTSFDGPDQSGLKAIALDEAVGELPGFVVPADR